MIPRTIHEVQHAMTAASLFDLDGKVAIVTGSSRGIGRAIAERLAQHGARVVISSRHLDACEEVAAAIRKRGGAALAHVCNISRIQELQALVNAAIQKWGGIDVLVCNAAVNPWFGPSLGMTDEAYDKIMGSNVRSNFWLCNMVLPQMAERGGGSIILVSSIAGLVGSASLGVYGISKAADMALARNICVEWGPRNVRANCIAPGLVRTEFARALWEDPHIHQRAVEHAALGRIGEPDEIAAAAVLLASPGGAFVTGQTIVIDGGAMAGRLA